ncbi:MAG: class I SAM-dependent methyltransferase [Lentisphaeria bacterium]|nr:class I SAM-dependent methyltransferase [Lentisphaeria bacterium]
MKEYVAENAKVIDGWCRDGWEWSLPVSHEVYEEARRGNFRLLLTPVKPVPRGWFGELRGRRVLALAAGGGQQGPLLAAQGAEVTVMDFSEEQLRRERGVREREGYAIRIVQGDMSEAFPFGDGEFDLIVHPVANVYVRDVAHVWRECARVLKPGGLLMAGLDNGINFITDDGGTRIENALPFDPLADEELRRKSLETNSGFQFSHTAGEQLGGQLKAGFELIDLYEDTNGSGRLHELNIPAFWATLARKR